MKKLIVIFMLALLAGCASNNAPVKIKWPAVPPELNEPSEELTPLADDKNTLADMIDNANTNYAKYYLLKDKYKAWQDWYKTQQSIYDSAN